jgi:hypothetical protein
MTHLSGTVAGAVVLAFAATNALADQRPAFVPANDEIRSVEVASQPPTYELPGGDGSFELVVSAACSPRRPAYSDVTLGWKDRGAAAGVVRVDVTGFSDGFATGRYVTSGARPAARRSLTFADGEAGVYYYWRLLTRTSEGWRVRANGRFEAPTCPHDPLDE